MNNVLNDYAANLIRQGLINQQNNISECKKDFTQMYHDGIECESEEQQKEIINKFLNKWEKQSIFS